MADEPAGAGAGMGGGGGVGTRSAGGQFGRNYGASASFDLKLPGLEAASKHIASVNAQLSELSQTLKGLGSNQYMLSQGINKLLAGITAQAGMAAKALAGVNVAAGAIGRGGGGGALVAAPSAAAAPTYGAYSTASETGWQTTAQQSAASAVGAAGGGGGGGGFFGGGGGGGGGGGIMDMLSAPLNLLGDLNMFPMRFLRDRIQTNRQSALYSSQALSGMAFASGRSSSIGLMEMMGSLARNPLMGTQQDLIAAATTGRAAGANIGLGGIASARAPGYMMGLAEMQRMTPGQPLGALAGQLGGQISNVQSQQVSAFLTSGAFALARQGGGMKSVSEWAEGILRWLENQRPGRDRGKAFNYGELLSQHFPGSNIDAWLNTNGVSPDMKEAFWNYAEGKAKTTGGTQGDFQVLKPSGNLAWERLRSQTEFTRGEFRLSSMMSGQYANREASNRWFNSLMATIASNVIPRITGPGSPLSLIQSLPDFIEEMLMGLLESTGPFGSIIGGQAFNLASILGGVTNIGMNTGQAGAGGAFGGSAFGGGGISGGAGDVGDIGDYGLLGGSTTAGLHPDMRRRVDAMMAANPRLQVNSGLRDRSTQMRLKKRGFANVSGGPSSHTRGLAADLGPKSEYGWIVNNAGKFGLASGARQGEPWHVGMGDIPDIGQEIPFVSDAFGGVLDAAGNLPVVGGVVDAARNVDDVIGMLGQLFGGLIDSIKRMGQVLGGGLLSIKDLMAGGDIGSFLGKNIGGFMNLLLGPFGQFATGGGAVTPFNPNAGAALPTNIALGGATRGYFAPTFGGGSVGGGAGGGGGGSWGGGATGTNQQIGQQMAAARGWTGSQWAALQELWQGESEWRTDADNPSSSAYGIPQALPGSKMATAGADWKTNPATQIKWGLDYIVGRYGDPISALRFWKSKSPHWYAGGAWSTDSGMAQLHQDEMVLPASVAEQVRLAMNGGSGGGSSSGMVFHNTFNIGGGGGGGSQGGIDIRRTVTTIADHLEQEMRKRNARNN